jgi:hypothetical protein
VYVETVTRHPPSLVDPYLKTTRAKVHLEELREELSIFKYSKPYSISTEDDVERDRFRIKIDSHEIPDKVSLIVGDLLYCLRSSLDQLVWSLAKLNVRDPKRTQFPIFEIDNRETRRSFKQQTAGIPAYAVSIIEGLQPYHGPDAAAIRSRLLWRLNALCNIDKHRRIPLHSFAQDFNFPKVRKSTIALIEFHQGNVVSVPLRCKCDMTLDPEVAMEIIFGDMSAGVECSFDGIERIYNFVTDSVIPRFGRFFK